MNTLSVVLGVVLILFGCYAAMMRRRGSSPKLEAMKKFFGARTGLIFHWVFYTVIPVVYGVVAILLGLQGKSFF